MSSRRRAPRRNRKGRCIALAPAAVALAAAAGLLVALKSPGRGGSNAAAETFSCSVVAIVDGDGLRCSETEASGRQIRIRLSGIAARERDGTCTRGHPCPQASAAESTAALERLAAGRRLTCRQVGSTYGRRAAGCSAPASGDLSCAMAASGTVVRWEKYWGSHRC